MIKKILAVVLVVTSCILLFISLMPMLSSMPIWLDPNQSYTNPEGRYELVTHTLAIGLFSASIGIFTALKLATTDLSGLFKKQD